jgi:hypothetical protein
LHPVENHTLCIFALKNMITKDLVQLYFQRVKEKSDWPSLIGEDMKFESPAPTAFGKEAYVTAASRFFQMVESLKINHLVVEGDTASAWLDYTLCLKNGRRFNCLVSELLEVRNNQIVSSVILFDTLALKTFTSQP